MTNETVSRITPEVRNLITSFDYCMDKNCLLCAVLINNRIKELTEGYPKVGKCGEFAEVAAEMISREEELRGRMHGIR